VKPGVKLQLSTLLIRVTQVVAAVTDKVDSVDRAQPEGIDQCFPRLVSCCLCFDAATALGFGIDLLDIGP
jgi:hypothetical protein